MSRYPHTNLLIGRTRTVVISGPHLHILDTATGDILHSSTTLEGPDKDGLLKSGPVRCTALSNSQNVFVTAGDDKKLKVWDIEGLKLLSSRELPKKPTCVQFTKNDDILVADKFGDVFRYTLHPSDEPSTSQNPKRDALTSHENPSGGQLVLGHASLLTAALLTPDQQFIVTADRDEHIRVSWYPEGYTIESYCLGHQKFVSAIHIPSFSPGTLVSGGGDPVLKVWDWMTGSLQRNVDVFTSVQPFMKIRAPRRRKNADNGGDEEDKGKRSRRKNKGKGKQPPSAGQVEGESEPAPSAEGSNEADATELVFVVHKIESLASEEGHYIIFSVVGATAIFIYSNAASDITPNIQPFDFGRPIIDFTLAEDGFIWALLDAEVVEADDTSASGNAIARFVRVLQWSSSQFIEKDLDTLPLLSALNSTCVCPATAADLKTLDLYSDLSSLPKNTDGDADATGREGSEMNVNTPEDSSALGDASEKTLKKRELGRLKHKQALQRLQQGDGDEKVGEPEPENKRVRADEGLSESNQLASTS
ncbi:WD40 repeat-like protein [Leucogyrophana mollusca]|uniref:WD40 repeat-like protein n=1 Tax=Leucogyrophana mollusca TaxID=85980 RepID=A0ACB8BKZ4_9AGAM|nr:WD40 repeat-like protein [Leucogyrophana mollusca]